MNPVWIINLDITTTDSHKTIQRNEAETTESDLNKWNRSTNTDEQEIKTWESKDTGLCLYMFHCVLGSIVFGPWSSDVCLMGLGLWVHLACFQRRYRGVDGAAAKPLALTLATANAHSAAHLYR